MDVQAAASSESARQLVWHSSFPELCQPTAKFRYDPRSCSALCLISAFMVKGPGHNKVIGGKALKVVRIKGSQYQSFILCLNQNTYLVSSLLIAHRQMVNIWDSFFISINSGSYVGAFGCETDSGGCALWYSHPEGAHSSLWKCLQIHLSFMLYHTLREFKTRSLDSVLLEPLGDYIRVKPKETEEGALQNSGGAWMSLECEF